MAILLAPLLGACVYKMDIQQGNYVTQEMAVQLRMGMSKEQVRNALGTPLLADPFHGERWDYVYWREDEQRKREQRRFAVFFADGKLVRLDGDIVPLKETPKETLQETPKETPQETPKETPQETPKETPQ